MKKIYKHLFILIVILITLNGLIFISKIKNYNEKMELIEEYEINISNGDILVQCENGDYEKVTTKDPLLCGTIPNPSYNYSNILN